MVPKRTQGMTILEVLMALLIFTFVIIGFMKGITDFMLYLRSSKMEGLANELGEKIRGEILGMPYNKVTECFKTADSTQLNFNSTIDENFYIKECPFSNRICNNILYCLYCANGSIIIPTTNNTCEIGHSINVGYNALQVLDETGLRIGYMIGIKIYYNDARTGKEKERNIWVYRKEE